MTFNLPEIIGTIDTSDITSALAACKIQVIHARRNDYFLQHDLSDEQFDEAVKAVVKHCKLKPQSPDWFPGNPDASDPASYGYYVCPIDANEYYDGDFDMLISTNMMSFC